MIRKNFAAFDPQMPTPAAILQRDADELRQSRQENMGQLRQFCEERLAEVFSSEERHWVDQRLRQELETIQTYGQASSFKDAKRAVQLLRDQGGTCRLIGAGSSSLVSYLMQLSEIDPMKHGLPYERFLETNLSRTIKFQFVAHLPTDKSGDGFSPIQDGLSSGAVSIQQMTSVEAMPCSVAEEIRRIAPDFELTSIPLDDEATFETIRSGNVEGIKSFEGVEAQRLLSDMKPQCLTDIAAITAIQIGEVHESGMLDEFIRRRINDNHKRPEHWLVEETLQETRGMILFQEQIMFILNRVADISLADAYSFIKAACKRQWEQVATIREWFVVEAVGNGVNEPDARTLFEGIWNAATRAVCKAHHLSEAATIYQTAFLKTHFPKEFSRTL